MSNIKIWGSLVGNGLPDVDTLKPVMHAPSYTLLVFFMHCDFFMFNIKDLHIDELLKLNTIPDF
jgi:hypothetical protein